MRERRYGVETGVPRPSPRRPPSSYREYSPRRRHDGEKYPREAERLRGIERRDGFNRDLNLRDQEFSDKVNRDRDRYRDGDRDRDRDRDRYRIGARRSRSPRRIVRGDSIDKDLSARASDYNGRDRDKYGVGVKNPRRLYEEDLLRGDSTSTKFQWVHLLDVPRKSYGFNVKNNYRDDYFGVGDTNLTRGDGERDSYPKSQYTDASRVGLSSVSQNFDGTKPILLEYEKGGRMHSDSYSLAHSEIGGGTKSYLGAGAGAGACSNHMTSMASQYLNTDTDKQGYLRFKNEIQLEKRGEEFADQEERYFRKKDEEFYVKDDFRLDKLGIERPKERAMFKTKEEDYLLSSGGYLKGDSEHILSSSRSKDYVPMSLSTLDNSFPGYSTGEIHLSSRGIRPGTGLVTEPFGLDGYGEKQPSTSSRGPGGQFDNIKNYSRLYGGLPEEKLGDHIYPEFGRSTQHGDHLYPEFGRNTKSRDAGEQYGVQHMSSFGHLDSIDEINKSSNVKHMENNRVWDKFPSSPGGSTSNNFDACGSRHTRKHDLEMLGSGSLHLNYGREAYCGRGSTKQLEHNDEVYGDSRPLFERENVFPTKEFDPSLGIVHGNLRKGSALADLSSLEPSERRFGGKHSTNDILYEHGDRIRISSDGSGARAIYNHIDAGNGVDHASLHKLNKTGTESREMAGYKISSSQFTTSHSSDLHKCGFKDIKKRLGPVPRKLHVSQRLVKKYKPSIKKRLAPVPSKKHATLPWLTSMSSNKLPSIEDVSDEHPLDQDGEHLGNIFPIAKPEPPEKSEDFKQLVCSAFFKFLKQINETPKIRKKYMEQGKGGSLKCIVCGSNPNEFAGTEKLAMHALTSDKVGLRSQHFGLYKALCLLMGWKSAEEPSSDWHCEPMSNAETSALKEDLIIWPPVMIVHNCSIDNKKSSELVVVSPETLDTKLRVMGFGSILKVSNGKPGNQSVMVVRFNSTLSGLQEAERLHQSYLEKQHGRAHLKHLKSSKNTRNSIEATQVLPADDEESFLYGYLGIAEDLDKLDFVTKKRCVVRSKKEILSIVNASV